ncbi:MAG TPA: adenylate/guanylate cyclase domain-containing protein [Candidatus Bilamarchaeum sp.]|nr:adenylate/guanylate cyclase domain-containing protein [Candidatus Bilamarchaeum sp.]
MNDLALALPRNAIAYRDELARGRVTHGYAAFTDFKGFTSLTESLKGLGKEGAEIIANTIDELILPIARAAMRSGGNIIAVEGDALLVSFESREGLFSFASATRPLCRNTVDTKIGRFDVSLDMGVGSGLIYELVVGDGSRRAYVVSGEALDRAYAMEKLSDVDIVADAPYAESEKVSKGSLAGYRLKLDRYREYAIDTPSMKEDEYTRSFIPGGVRGGSFSEFLPVTAAFCDLGIIKALIETGSLEKSRDAINEIFLEAHRIVEVSGGGTIDKFKEYNSLFLFGAPEVHVDDSMRAVEAMAELMAASDRIRAKYGIAGGSGRRAGINKGIVFSGEICGRYSVMGDAVNTAARIKEKADGIFITAGVLGELRNAEAVSCGQMVLKGKEEAVEVHAFRGFGEGRKEEFILRAGELERLRARVRASSGRTALINVTGEAGSGGDTLLTHLCNSLTNEGAEAHEIKLSPLHKIDPYRAIIEMAKKTEGCASDEELLGKLGRRKIGDAGLMAELGKSLASGQRAFMITNGDNLDRESAAFISALCAKEAGGSAVFVVSSTENSVGGEVFALGPLGRSESIRFARHMARKIHGTETFSDGVLEGIYDKSRGNPLFIAELVKSARKTQAGLGFDEEIPEKLEQLLLANVTRLPNDLKLALKLFSLAYQLDGKAVGRFGMAGEARRLSEAGFLAEDFSFSNETLRKVVQDQIPSGLKREYYTRIAVVCDEMYQGDYFLLSHYFSNAETSRPEIRERAVLYLDKYLKGHGDLSIVGAEKLERLVQLADVSLENEKKACIDALLGLCKIKHVNATRKEDYGAYYEIAEKAFALSAGSGYEYKALLEMGRSLCWSGRFGEGFRMLGAARESALGAGDIPSYGNISSIYGYVLSYRAGMFQEGVELLEETERVIVGQIRDSGEVTKEFGYTLSSLYFALAECHNKARRYDVALSYLRRAGYYSEQFSIYHILVQSLGTMGESYYHTGEYAKAREMCLRAEYIMDRNGVNIKFFKKELFVLLSMIYEKMGERDKARAHKLMADSL